MLYTRHITEELATVATIDPVSQGVGAINSDAVDMAQHRKVEFTLALGVLGAAATVDFKLRQGQGVGMANVKDIAGKVAAQCVKATDDNKQVIIEVRAEELDVQNGFNYCYATVTVGAAASLIALVAKGTVARYSPASDFDLASVKEIVTA